AAGHDVGAQYGSDKGGAGAVAARCAEHGVDTRVVGADLATDLETLTAVVDELGGVGVLVNNAGRTADSLSLSMSDDAFRDVLEVNLTAAFRLSRAVLRGMLRARQGRIVNLSSVVGLHGNAGQANYAARDRKSVV